MDGWMGTVCASLGLLCDFALSYLCGYIFCYTVLFFRIVLDFNFVCLCLLLGLDVVST